MTRNYEIMHSHNRNRPGSGDLIRTATHAVPPGPMSFRKPQGSRNDSKRFLVPPQPKIPTWLQQTSAFEHDDGALEAVYSMPVSVMNRVDGHRDGRGVEGYRDGRGMPASAWVATETKQAWDPDLVDSGAQPAAADVVVKPLGLSERQTRVSVVIPALNEAENLQHVLPRIPRWVDEVLLVDGLSTDGTAEVAQSLWPGVKIVEQTERGKGAALRAGFAAATGDIIVMLDADGSTDPAEIPVFVGALLAGADFVKGSRFMQGAGSSDMTPLRRLGNLGFVWLVRLMYGGGFTDLCYGYSAFWRDELPKLDLDADGFEIETLMNVRALLSNMKVKEVPSFEYDRIHGTSRLQTFPDGWRVLKTIFREWRHIVPNLPRRRSRPGRLTIERQLEPVPVRVRR